MGRKKWNTMQNNKRLVYDERKLRRTLKPQGQKLVSNSFDPQRPGEENEKTEGD